MKEAKSRTEPKTGGDAAAEFGAVTIDFNPGPDAEDRLRRLFTLLLKHAAGEGGVAPDEDSTAGTPVDNGIELDAAARAAHPGDAL